MAGPAHTPTLALPPRTQLQLLTVFRMSSRPPHLSQSCLLLTFIRGFYIYISPSRFGDRTAGSYSTHLVLKATFRALGKLPCHLDPETQSSTLFPLSPWDMTCVVFPVVRD